MNSGALSPVGLMVTSDLAGFDEAAAPAVTLCGVLGTGTAVAPPSRRPPARGRDPDAPVSRDRQGWRWSTRRRSWPAGSEHRVPCESATSSMSTTPSKSTNIWRTAPMTDAPAGPAAVPPPSAGGAAGARARSASTASRSRLDAMTRWWPDATTRSSIPHLRWRGCRVARIAPGSAGCDGG